MERTKWPAIGGLVLGTYSLTRTISTTFALDRPVHTSIAILASSATVLIAFSRRLPRDDGTSHQGQEYNALPLDDITDDQTARPNAASAEDVRYPSSLRKLRIVFLLLVASICLRVETLRVILLNSQCAVRTWEPLIPFILAAWDYWNVQRHRKHTSTTEDPDASVYDVIEQRMVGTRSGYVSAAALVSFGSIFALSATGRPSSTYICATSLRYTWQVPLMQHLGPFLDLAILCCIHHLLRQREGRGQRGLRLRFTSVAWSFLVSAIILFIVGLVWFLAVPDDRAWITTISRLYLWSLFKLDIAVCLTVVCGLLTIYHTCILITTMLVCFVSVAALTTNFAWSHLHPFPPLEPGLAFVAICLAIFGFALYFHIEAITEDHTSVNDRTIFRRVPSWFYLFILGFFILRAGVWVARSTSLTYHPIDLLVFEAQRVHEVYLNQTATSSNLTAAVSTYRERYSRHPPPGFDTWYNYATARNSVVIDDFDSIHRDLLPFYSLTPETIRQRTWDMISNPWNDAAGISIRNGVVAISPNVVPTHRWMLDGIVDMVGHFAEFLPDMDLAFNLNDECRIAVPYENLQAMCKNPTQGQELVQTPQAQFSQGRAEQWQPIPDPPNTESSLTHISFQRTFNRFGNSGCPSGSPARKQRIWEKSGLCTKCTAPHSLGAFLANWTIAGDVCHQPDMADLHGLYTSPAAFKASHTLYPIFSQSKAHGFNDILYPSAWNYIDKVKYDPNPDHPDPLFSSKDNTLFWRGATSEGVSPGGGQWRGMTRQRFVHLASNTTSHQPSQHLLLPTSPSSTHLHYVSVPHPQLTTLLSTSIHIVDSIARCGGPDCPDQALEFSPLYPPSDFQSHWQYRYLLDLDGAGFSGRFLPFLLSHSLPFKAGIFREWWDDRLTAWAHFVPLDVRGHGLWPTLAYFAGVKGEINGKWVDVEGHEGEGRLIAEQGREWAEKVLRKEDMEIYMFRLLLEWGRVTDDGRDGLGFSV